MKRTEYDTYKPVSSVRSFLEVVTGIYKDWGVDKSSGTALHVWFRGQQNDYPLTPSILRPTDDGKEFDEFFIINTFRSLYKNYTSSAVTNESELFALMQHVGTPTRLLDWSESALVGLYFSVENAGKTDDPVVWVMYASELNRISDQSISSPITSSSLVMELRFRMAGYFFDGGLSREYFNFYPDDQKHVTDITKFTYPLAYVPQSSGNQRIAIQKGVFTIHGINRVSIEDTFKMTGKQKFLRKLTIARKNIERIQNELRILGITPRSIYPDLFGLSQELRSKFYRR